MGTIRQKRSPVILIAMLGSGVSATALVALDARGNDIPPIFSVIHPQPSGAVPGEATLLGREAEPDLTVVLAMTRVSMVWPEPVVVLLLLVGYAAAVLARERLDPVRVRTPRP